MEHYKIHQLVYTKLNEGESPFNKEDFHTVFFPLDLLTSTDVLVLENHIYIPGNEDFSSKQVVYFNKIKDKTYLNVFDINILPNEFDKHGRGGIFICHVFMFPQDLWQQIPSPNKLLELVTENKYNSRSELLSSKYIDVNNGNMKPIEIDSNRINKVDKNLPPLEIVFEVKLLLNLLDSFKPENKEQKFIINASEKEARLLFNKLICYIPNEQKVNIGWDTMYDSGRIMDYNKTFVAYENNAPRGGSGSTIIYLSKKIIELAKDFKVSENLSPFAKWVTNCAKSIETSYFIETADKLSKALLANKICDLDDNWNLECFAKANNELVEKLFSKKSKKEFKRKLSKELSKIMSIKDKLLFYNDKLPASIISNYLLNIIEKSKISAKHLKNGISEKYIKQYPVLELIKQLWDTEKFDNTVLNTLEENQKLQLNKYMLKTSIQKEVWFLELIENDKTLLNYYIKQYPKPKRIIRRFRRILGKNESEINKMGFSILVIRRVFFFKMSHFFTRIIRPFTKKKKVTG